MSWICLTGQSSRNSYKGLVKFCFNDTTAVISFRHTSQQLSLWLTLTYLALQYASWNAALHSQTASTLNLNWMPFSRFPKSGVCAKVEHSISGCKIRLAAWHLAPSHMKRMLTKLHFMTVQNENETPRKFFLSISPRKEVRDHTRERKIHH